MSAHTPGPWAVGYGGKDCAVYFDTDHTKWLVKDQVARFPRSDEGEANARLIAAAPKMRDACELICEHAEQVLTAGHALDDSEDAAYSAAKQALSLTEATGDKQ